MFAGEDATIEVDARRRRPRGEAAESRRNTAKAPRRRVAALRPRKAGTAASGIAAAAMFGRIGAGAFRQPWREAGAGNAGAGKACPGMRARECVLCDEYAYIRAKRGRRRIGFAGSAGRNPTGARERRIFRGDALLAGEAWPAASPFGAPDRAHMYMWRFLATACAGSEPSVSVHVAKARIESR